MATIKDIQTKNTMLFLSNYTDELINYTKEEILRRRKRDYATGTRTTQINASGKGISSLKKVSTDDGFDVEGNSYLEDVDEGTQSTRATLTDILRWVKTKPVKFKNPRGGFEKVTASRQKSLAKLIQKSLVFNGIQRTSFLTDLVENSYDKLTGIENNVADDVIDSIEDMFEFEGLTKKGKKYVLDIKR